MGASVLERSTVLGNFRIEEVLGRGATAVVYEASDLVVTRRVALKLLGAELSSDPVFAARFRREGQLQASLEHPHVVTVFEAGDSEYGLYIAMRLVRGPTLATLEVRRALGAGRALALLGHVAAALDAAHDAGLVHRDVKPQNVLVDRSDHAYLADFGLTKLGGDAGVTVLGGIVGTLAYLAPEVIRGQPATPASDRYAFAAMLFECLAGQVVFPRGTEAAVLYAHTSERPPPISRVRVGLPPALDDLLAGALAKDPHERPASAAALVAAVREVLGGEQGAALGPPPPSLGPASAATIVPLALSEIGTPASPLPGPTLSSRLRTPLRLGGAALAGAGTALAVVALLGGLHGVPPTGVPRIEKGAIALGSSLALPGWPSDCRGRAPGPESPPCTIAQSALPNRVLVAPSDGVIRRWAVRDARGELALQVLTERDGKLHQLSRSASEFVPDTGTHSFATDLALSQSDFVGIEPIAGAAVGVRSGVDGARLERWVGPVGGREIAAGAGRNTSPGQELLLRVEVLPGGTPVTPAGVFGPPAATLSGGQVDARRSFSYADGLRARLELVNVGGGRVALDELRDGRRVARINVPGLRPGGRVINFIVDHSPAKLTEVGIFVEYANLDSQRLIEHYYLVHPFDLQFLN